MILQVVVNRGELKWLFLSRHLWMITQEHFSLWNIISLWRFKSIVMWNHERGKKKQPKNNIKKSPQKKQKMVPHPGLFNVTTPSWSCSHKWWSADHCRWAKWLCHQYQAQQWNSMEFPHSQMIVQHRTKLIGLHTKYIHTKLIMICLFLIRNWLQLNV